MLLVTVDVLRNALTPDQKELLIEKITTALVEVEGENIRPVTWVRINGGRGIGPRYISTILSCSARQTERLLTGEMVYTLFRTHS